MIDLQGFGVLFCGVAYTLAIIQNLAFYLWLVGEARHHILAGDFSSWKKDILPRIRQRF